MGKMKVHTLIMVKMQVRNHILALSNVWELLLLGIDAIIMNYPQYFGRRSSDLGPKLKICDPGLPSVSKRDLV